MKFERVRNANKCSSLAIGAIGFPFNTANLQDVGYLLSGSVAIAFNARSTPRWMENDQSRHDNR